MTRRRSPSDRSTWTSGSHLRVPGQIASCRLVARATGPVCGVLRQDARPATASRCPTRCVQLRTWEEGDDSSSVSASKA